MFAGGGGPENRRYATACWDVIHGVAELDQVLRCTASQAVARGIEGISYAAAVQKYKAEQLATKDHEAGNADRADEVIPRPQVNQIQQNNQARKVASLQKKTKLIRHLPNQTSTPGTTRNDTRNDRENVYQPTRFPQQIHRRHHQQLLKR